MQKLLTCKKNREILEIFSNFEGLKTILVLVSSKIYKMRTLQLDLFYKINGHIRIYLPLSVTVCTQIYLDVIFVLYFDPILRVYV